MMALKPLYSYPVTRGIRLVMQVREISDVGRSVVVTEPGNEHAKPYFAIAEKVWAAIEKAKAAAKP